MEYQKLPWMRIPSYIIQEITQICYLWHRTIYWIIHKEPEDVPLVEFLVLVFTCMPGESYHKWLRSLLCLCVTWLSLPHDIAVITVPYLKKPVLTIPCPRCSCPYHPIPQYSCPYHSLPQDTAVLPFLTPGHSCLCHSLLQGTAVLTFT